MGRQLADGPRRRGRTPARARLEGRILVTLDKDFGELIIVHRMPHCGILRRPPRSQDVLRLRQRNTSGLSSSTDSIHSFASFRPSRSRSSLRSRASSRSRILACADRSSFSLSSRSTFRSSSLSLSFTVAHVRAVPLALGVRRSCRGSRGLEYQTHEHARLEPAVRVGDGGAELRGSRIGIDRLVNVIHLGVDRSIGAKGKSLSASAPT